jgi:hypothetical protein
MTDNSTGISILSQRLRIVRSFTGGKEPIFAQFFSQVGPSTAWCWCPPDAAFDQFQSRTELQRHFCRPESPAIDAGTNLAQVTRWTLTRLLTSRGAQSIRIYKDRAGR